ncbi:MAG: hypothetical protein JRJ00_05145 [Deltaproteobacteria bacterium]|nr:hypothetical protein [Deltaproteobacteria bacterium]
MKKRARPPWVLVIKGTPLWGEAKPGPLAPDTYSDSKARRWAGLKP